MKKEYNILNYFNMRALFMGIGVSRLLIRSNEYTLISLILGTILGMLIIHFLKLELKKSWANVFVASIFFIIALNLLVNMISTMFLTEMPKFIVGLPITLLILYILNKKEVVTFRVANILLVLNVSLYILSVITLLPYIKLENFSYTATPITNIFTSSIEYALISVVPVLVTKDKAYAKIPLLKTYLLSSITMGIMIIITYGILGSNLVSIYRYPEYIILKKISVLNFLENIENIISFVWIFDIIIFLLSNGQCIKKNVKNNLVMNILIPILLIITAIINQHYIIIISIYRYAPIILSILLGILLLFNRKKHQLSS